MLKTHTHKISAKPKYYIWYYIIQRKQPSLFHLQPGSTRLLSPTPPTPPPSTSRSDPVGSCRGPAEQITVTGRGHGQGPRCPNLPDRAPTHRAANLLPGALVPGQARPGGLRGPRAASAHHRPTKPRTPSDPIPGRFEGTRV